MNARSQMPRIEHFFYTTGESGYDFKAHSSGMDIQGFARKVEGYLLPGELRLRNDLDEYYSIFDADQITQGAYKGKLLTLTRQTGVDVHGRMRYYVFGLYFPEEILLTYMNGDVLSGQPTFDIRLMDGTVEPLPLKLDQRIIGKEDLQLIAKLNSHHERVILRHVLTGIQQGEKIIFILDDATWARKERLHAFLRSLRALLLLNLPRKWRAMLTMHSFAQEMLQHPDWPFMLNFVPRSVFSGLWIDQFKDRAEPITIIDLNAKKVLHSTQGESTPYVSYIQACLTNAPKEHLFKRIKEVELLDLRPDGSSLHAYNKINWKFLVDEYWSHADKRQWEKEFEFSRFQGELQGLFTILTEPSLPLEARRHFENDLSSALSVLHFEHSMTNPRHYLILFKEARSFLKTMKMQHRTDITLKRLYLDALNNVFQPTHLFRSSDDLQLVLTSIIQWAPEDGALTTDEMLATFHQAVSYFKKKHVTGTLLPKEREKVEVLWNIVNSMLEDGRSSLGSMRVQVLALLSIKLAKILGHGPSSLLPLYQILMEEKTRDNREFDVQLYDRLKKELTTVPDLKHHFIAWALNVHAQVSDTLFDTAQLALEEYHSEQDIKFLERSINLLEEARNQGQFSFISLTEAKTFYEQILTDLENLRNVDHLLHVNDLVLEHCRSRQDLTMIPQLVMREARALNQMLSLQNVDERQKITWFVTKHLQRRLPSLGSEFRVMHEMLRILIQVYQKLSLTSNSFMQDHLIDRLLDLEQSNGRFKLEETKLLARKFNRIDREIDAWEKSLELLQREDDVREVVETYETYLNLLSRHLKNLGKSSVLERIRRKKTSIFSWTLNRDVLLATRVSVSTIEKVHGLMGIEHLKFEGQDLLEEFYSDLKAITRSVRSENEINSVISQLEKLHFLENDTRLMDALISLREEQIDLLTKRYKNPWAIQVIRHRMDIVQEFIKRHGFSDHAFAALNRLIFIPMKTKELVRQKNVKTVENAISTLENIITLVQGQKAHVPPHWKSQFHERIIELIPIFFASDMIDDVAYQDCRNRFINLLLRLDLDDKDLVLKMINLLRDNLEPRKKASFTSERFRYVIYIASKLLTRWERRVTVQDSGASSVMEEIMNFLVMGFQKIELRTSHDLKNLRNGLEYYFKLSRFASTPSVKSHLKVLETLVEIPSQYLKKPDQEIMLTPEKLIEFITEVENKFLHILPQEKGKIYSIVTEGLFDVAIRFPHHLKIVNMVSERLKREKGAQEKLMNLLARAFQEKWSFVEGKFEKTRMPRKEYRDLSSLFLNYLTAWRSWQKAQLVEASSRGLQAEQVLSNTRKELQKFILARYEKKSDVNRRNFVIFVASLYQRATRDMKHLVEQETVIALNELALVLLMALAATKNHHWLMAIQHVDNYLQVLMEQQRIKQGTPPEEMTRLLSPETLRTEVLRITWDDFNHYNDPALLEDLNITKYWYETLASTFLAGVMTQPQQFDSEMLETFFDSFHVRGLFYRVLRYHRVILRMIQQLGSAHLSNLQQDPKRFFKVWSTRLAQTFKLLADEEKNRSKRGRLSKLREKNTLEALDDLCADFARMPDIQDQVILGHRSVQESLKSLFVAIYQLIPVTSIASEKNLFNILRNLAPISPDDPMIDELRTAIKKEKELEWQFNMLEYALTFHDELVKYTDTEPPLMNGAKYFSLGLLSLSLAIFHDQLDAYLKHLEKERNEASRMDKYQRFYLRLVKTILTTSLWDHVLNEQFKFGSEDVLALNDHLERLNGVVQKFHPEKKSGMLSKIKTSSKINVLEEVIKFHQQVLFTSGHGRLKATKYSITHAKQVIQAIQDFINESLHHKEHERLLEAFSSSTWAGPKSISLVPLFQEAHQLLVIVHREITRHEGNAYRDTKEKIIKITFENLFFLIRILKENVPEAIKKLKKQKKKKEKEDMSNLLTFYHKVTMLLFNLLELSKKEGIISDKTSKKKTKELKNQLKGLHDDVKKLKSEKRQVTVQESEQKAETPDDIENLKLKGQPSRKDPSTRDDDDNTAKLKLIRDMQQYLQQMIENIL